jgi:periplasmic protein CpxP/Spy
MTPIRKRIVLAGLLASMGLVAFAQAPAAPQPAPGGTPPAHARMGGHDPAKMQQRMAERHAKHQTELKAKLKITASQEGAWTAFTASMTPPAGMQRPDRAEFEKLTTPQRIDKMRELRTQRNAAMDKRADATKTFYAALTPEQQKVFDTNTMRGGHDRAGHGGKGRHHGGMGGMQHGAMEGHGGPNS